MRAIARRKQHVLRKMPRRPARAAPPDPTRHNPLHAYQAEFIEWTLARGLSAQTAAIRKFALDHFIRWADERGLTRPQDINRPILIRYQRHLYHYRKADGAPLAFSTQATRLQPLRAFFKWLARENHLLYNPAADWELPKPAQRLPKVLWSVADVEAVLREPDVDTPMGLRNRAMLETLYSTGLRRAELTCLRHDDVDTERGLLMVRQGKGGKDRLLPIGARACGWIARYRDEVRPLLIHEPDPGTLFVTDYGEPFVGDRLSNMVRRYLRLAGLEHGACHAFRHAMATHMLDNGADIRFIQVMLGHSDLTTTERYTQVSIAKLKEVHTRTHPATLSRPDTTTASDSTLSSDTSSPRDTTNNPA